MIRSPRFAWRGISHASARVTALALGGVLLLAACDKPIATDITAAKVQQTLSATKTVIVGFHSAPTAADIAAVQAAGGEVTHQYKYINAVVVNIAEGGETSLAALPGVRYVDNNIEMEPLAGKQVTDWGISKIQAPGAWALGYRGQGVKVGIFDSGIDIDHPDLSVVGGVDLVGDGRGVDDCNGHGTHVAGIVAAKNNGNHTAGVAPQVQLYSMRFANCAWAGATLAKMIQGIEWAIDNGMNVVNMSFGFLIGVPEVGGIAPSPLPPGFPSTAAEDAFNAAHSRGVVLVGASGNSSTPYVSFPAAYASVIAVGATDDADMLATFSQWGTEQDVTAPGVNNLSSWLVGLGQTTSLTVSSDDGRELEAIALTFSGMTSTRGIVKSAVYAGFGTAADFAAVSCSGLIAVVSRGGPTFAQKAEAAMNAGCAALIIHNIHPGNFNGTLGAATAPDGRPWIPVVSISLEEGLYLKEQIESGGATLTLINSFGNLRIASGTSMAAPHASGVAALILSKSPGLSPEQVRSVLRNSADDLGAPGWDPVFGAGRVNALRAVQITP